MAQVASKLDYLGRGVDCREPKKNWLHKLDRYSTKKIRDFSEKDGNIIENPVTTSETELKNETTESKKRVEGSVKVTPHRSIDLGGELKVKRDSSTMTRYKIDSHSTRTVTLNEDTSQDLDIIKREGTDPPIHYTKYEQELSQFILDHIDAMQTEASTKGGEEATCLGKMIKDLKKGDSVARLEEYLQYARSEKELCQQIRQTLANACCSFINEKPYMYTHYVKSITLGAIQEESEESTDSNRDISAGANVIGFNAVGGSLKGGHQAVRKGNVTRNKTRGAIESDSGKVTAEEVIEASMELVSSLINKKSRELKIIMERLLKCYSCADQGVLLGPFHVSGKKQLKFREHEIYWQVIRDEIYGTTTASKASIFYIQCNEEQFCHIIHNTSDLKIQLFATVQRPFDTECPLKLVPYPKHKQDICFTLMSATKQPVPVPQTEDEWKSGSPFFIKLPAGGVPIIGHLYKPARYINVRRIIEEWKNKPISSDADSTSDTPPAPKSKETKETRETQNRESTAENLKYSTGSSASLDEPGQHVITTQFYFTPVGSIQGSRVTFAGGPPPPPPSRIESDSASGGNEVTRQQQEVDDARLKQDFIELVGSEYVFPLPVRAVNIHDTQQ